MNIDQCGCLDPADLPLTAIENRPALPAIRYRIGTYATFRRAMLAAIGSHPELNQWQVREDDDYGVAFIDMWAYLADILTFYQERIANEAFIRTATQQESVATLAATLDYKPSPGMAAQTYLAFDADAGKQVDVPVGLKVQSVPGQHETPQKFETLQAITAYSSLNRIGLQQTQVAVVRKGATSLRLKGTSTRLNPGDYILLAVSYQQAPQWDVRQLATAQADPVTSTTTVSWLQPTVVDYQALVPWGVQVWAFRQQASLFGYNAPDWNTIPDSWKDDDKHEGPYPDWTDATLPEDTTNPKDVYLDRVYPQLVPNTWAVLITEEPAHRMKALFSISKVAKSNRVNYTLSGSATRLTFREQPALSTFGIRSTLALVQSEELSLADVQIPFVGGNTLHLDALYPGLAAGRNILLEGQLRDGTWKSALVVVEEVTSFNKKTIIKVDRQIAQYVTGTVTLYGNVAVGGHGETVPAEPVGSGDASTPFQTFTLSKAPVTFVPHAGSPHGAQDTVVLRVGGVQWQEVATLLGSGPSAPVFTAGSDQNGKMMLTFGDGSTGARLPTGQNNVTASYRRGIGAVGNLRKAALTNLLDRPLGLSSVVNPDPAGGGADAEAIDKTRINAPNTVRTFGRIVSLQDFADAALEYTGIEKARAALQSDKSGLEFVNLTVAGFDPTPIDDPTLGLLAADLDSRRDPNEKLVLRSGLTQPITISVAIDHAPDRTAADVQDAVRQALLAYLAWDNVDFGRAVELTDVYRIVQNVVGVVGAQITKLDLRGSTGLQTTIQVDPTQIPTLAESDLSVGDWTPAV